MRYHAVVLVVAGALAYATSFASPFLPDDQAAIVSNASIRALSPVTAALTPPPATAVAGRPLVNLSLAVNYATGGLDVGSYHATNLALHLLTALVLFGAIRRTLGLPGMPVDLSQRADALALAAALVWTLHPLNTDAVDYIVRRSESMMALCYVATLYCAIRASAHPRSWGWHLAAVAVCAAGMASKETMVTAPLAVLVYDRVFLYPSAAEALRERRALYLGLAATWAVFAALALTPPGTAPGLTAGASVWTYVLNQPPIIARYLWLTVWPRPLVVDYGLPRSLPVVDVVIAGLLLLALAVATLAALRRHPKLGYLGVWFFLTLAPSSLVPFDGEVGAERRMYLPLMALAVLGVLGAFRLLTRRLQAASRVPVAALVAVCLLLAAGTTVRTLEYRSVHAIVQTNVDRYPHGRARVALAADLAAANEHSEALRQLEQAVKDYPPAYLGLATELSASGRMADAVAAAREFIRLVPDHADVPAAQGVMGRALALQGQLEPAVEQFTLVAKARPDDPAPLVSIGDARLRQRRVTEAIASYEAALRMRPGDPDILGQLGLAFGAAGRMSDASLAFGGAASVRPTDVRLLNLWGRSLAAEGRYTDAVVPMRRLVELAPSDGQARDNLRVIERLAAWQEAALAAAGAGPPSQP